MPVPLTTKSLAKLKGDRRHFKTAPKPECTYKGVCYDSKGERLYAEMLDGLVRAGTVRWWLRQAPVELGTDPVKRYRVDFLVNYDGEFEFVEVKARTSKPNARGCHYVLRPAFAQTIRLWREFGPDELRVVTPTATGFCLCETIPGGRAEL